MQAQSSNPIQVVAPAAPLAATQIHQSRWGFHPCDRETFGRLKAYHKLLFRDMQATRRHARWAAKLPKNRVRRFKDGRVEPIAEPVKLGTDHARYVWVLAEYRNARRPVGTPGEVVPLDMPRGWEAEFEKLREFYGKPVST